MPRIVIAGIIAAIAILTWLYWQQHRPGPLSVSGFVEADEIRVGSRVGGRVSEVLVAEGQSVPRGAPLFRLDPFDLQSSRARSEAELEGAKAEHQRLKNGFRKEEIEQARAKRDRAAAVLARLVAGPRTKEIEIAREELNRAMAQMEWAESEYRRLADLQERNNTAPVELPSALRTLKSSRADVAAAQQQLALLEEGSRAEDIAEARALLSEVEQGLSMMESGFRAEDIAQSQAKVTAAEASVAAIRVRLDETTVTSPCDCVVEAIELRPGDLVAPNAPSVSLIDLSRLWLRAYVPERFLAYAQPDRSVPLRIDGFSNTNIAGRITFVAKEGEFTPRNVQTPEERGQQTFRIKVLIESPPPHLRVGTAGDVILAESVKP